MLTPPTIIKIGGSILCTADDYRRVALQLAARVQREPTWVVVSAAQGVTDQLAALARAPDARCVTELLNVHAHLSGVPDAPALERELHRALAEAQRGAPAALLAWGEQASAAALRAHLFRLGVDLPIVELTARVRPPPHWAAIVPGFYLRDRHGRARSLPRGGSDISALLLALQLGARLVRFWKDGGGIRDENGLVTVTEIDGYALLERLQGTIRPLHPAALRIALHNGIDLVLEPPTGLGPTTRILTARPRPALSASVGSVAAPPL